MENSGGTQLRNDAIARRIIAVIAHNKNRANLQGEIEFSLDQALPNRKAAAASHATAASRTGDKHTSIAAAVTVNVTKRERSVLATMLRSAAALTTYDLESLTGIRYGSITPRMKPLLSKGLVSEVGVDTAAGRGRTLYKITKDGVKWLKKNPVAA